MAASVRLPGHSNVAGKTVECEEGKEGREKDGSKSNHLTRVDRHLSYTFPCFTLLFGSSRPLAR